MRWQYSGCFSEIIWSVSFYLLFVAIRIFFNYVQCTALEFCFCSKSLLLEAFSQRRNWVLRHRKRSEEVAGQQSLGRNKGNWDNNIHDSESCFHWEDGCWDALWVRFSGAELCVGKEVWDIPLWMVDILAVENHSKSLEHLSRQNSSNSGTSSVVLWLELQLGVQVRSLVSDPRSHRPRDQKHLI